MDELHLVRRHGEPVNVSKGVNIIMVGKRQNSDRSVSLKKQNKHGDKADDDSESVSCKQLITTVNSINIDRAPLREDTLRSEAEEEGKEVVRV